MHLRLVVTQSLLRTVDGNRVAAREYLVFDEYVRDRLLAHSVEEWPSLTRKLMQERGQTMAQAAEKYYRDGRIDERTYRLIATRYEADEEAV